ncbi:type 4b pilus protein PilO2 [Tatumella terrea]|uniref:Type 4b pilus protein PilO2 n=1 Tax=Tatumella terrea TaxID=419007 RepID=A0ABW1VV42_9GAMM
MAMQQNPPYCIRQGGRQLVAGLEWRYLPVRGRRKIRQRLPAGQQTFHVVLTNERRSDPGCLLGCVGLPPAEQGRVKRYPLALMALQKMPPDSYAICRLEEGLYWFVAKEGHGLSPFSDFPGTREETRHYVRQFLLLNRSETQWKEFRSDSPSVNGAVEKKQSFAGLTLDELLQHSPPLARKYRLKATDNRSRLRLAGALVVIGAAILSAVMWWNNYQQQQRIEAAQRYLLLKQQQGSAAETAPPWSRQPALSDVLSVCQQRTGGLPMVIAGWGLSHVSCKADPAGITAKYSLQGAGTVDDFSRQLQEHGLSGLPYRFNLPGAGDEAEIFLPFTLRQGTDRKTSASVPLTSLVSLAQQTHSELQLSEAAGIESGRFTVRTFTLVTPLSPRLLLTGPVMQAQNLGFIRLDISRTAGRLLFTLEGRLYEKQ